MPSCCESWGWFDRVNKDICKENSDEEMRARVVGTDRGGHSRLSTGVSAAGSGPAHLQIRREWHTASSPQQQRGSGVFARGACKANQWAMCGFLGCG